MKILRYCYVFCFGSAISFMKKASAQQCCVDMYKLCMTTQYCNQGAMVWTLDGGDYGAGLKFQS